MENSSVKRCVHLGCGDIIHHYKITGNDLARVISFLYGNQDYPYNYHFCGFNSPVLHQLFKGAGFTDTHPWDPKTAPFHDFEDYSNHPVSLNLEAQKP